MTDREWEQALIEKRLSTSSCLPKRSDIRELGMASDDQNGVTYVYATQYNHDWEYCVARWRFGTPHVELILRGGQCLYGL